MQAARRLATDERARRVAANTFESTVKPRAEAAWKAAKPRIDETRADIGQLAKDTDAQRNPARFAGRATKRILREFRRGSKKR